MLLGHAGVVAARIVVTRLSGTGLVADDLYLMAHDVTGQPFLQPRATGLGLAAGLLAELILAGRIAAWQGWPGARRRGADARPARQAVLGLLAADRERHPVSD